jgi:multiple sugar transport system permease protein
MFFEDFTFWHSLRVTLVLVGLYVPVSIAGSLFLAILANREGRGMRTFRAAFFLPSMIPMVAAVMLWLWIFSPRFGLLNYYLRSLGLPTSEWIASPGTVTLSVIIFLLWLSVGGPRMMIFLAGLKDIPVELYEAARIDGAGALYQFLKVTLPLLSPVVFLNLVIAVIYTFQVFVVAYSMTQGGPLNMTLYYVLYLYRNAFQFLKIGYASAIAWFLFVVIVSITAGQFWFSSRWVHFERE